MISSDPDMPSLQQLQAAMAARILDCASGSADAPLLGWVAVPAAAAAAERLDVYANGYPARVHDGLADTYPSFARIVGSAAFAALAQRYAVAVPLTSYNLNDAGASLAAFLGEDPLTRERPYLPDLAALEWAVARAFHAAERPPLDATALSWTLEEWERVVLEFQPSVAVMASRWPLLDLWEGADDPSPADGRGQEILVRRAGLMVRAESITAGEAAALRQLLDGRALGATMRWLDAAGHDPAAVSEWCGRWMQSGMVAGARLTA